MIDFKITLTVDNHHLKPKKIYKYKRLASLRDAWEYAREICSDYNKNHKSIAVVTGVAKN